MYTGTLREWENGSHYSWSGKAFKRWKKQFHALYETTHGIKLKTEVPSGNQREILYKKILWMPNIDIFNTGGNYTLGDNIKIDQAIIEKASCVAKILYTNH